MSLFFFISSTVHGVSSTQLLCLAMIQSVRHFWLVFNYKDNRNIDGIKMTCDTEDLFLSL